MGGVASERGPYTRGTRLKAQFGTGKRGHINMANAGGPKNKTSGEGPRAAVVTTTEAAETERNRGERVTESKGPDREEK